MSSPPTARAPVAPVPAATVVLVRPAARGPEVLLTQRPPTMAFGPNLHVFPGGRVDDGDAGSPAARTLRATGWRDDLVRAGAAAVREAQEEVGIEIPDPRRLIDLSRWVTPRTLPRRFDVHFFVAAVAAGTTARPAVGEVVAVEWLTPREALAAMAEGRLKLWLPTSATLQQLAWVDSIEALEPRLRAGRSGSPGTVSGPATPLEPAGLPVVGIETATAGGVAGRKATTWLVGEREFVVIDPGDPMPDAAARLEGLAARRGGRLVGVALTHLDPEHHAGVELFATDLGLPVVGGRGAARLAPYAVQELGGDDLVPFGDVPLAAVPLPGPSPEHTGFELVDRRAIACGDLLDDGPARATRGVLPPPDRPAWTASLERLQALQPATVLPSHGPTA